MLRLAAEVVHGNRVEFTKEGRTALGDHGPDDLVHQPRLGHWGHRILARGRHGGTDDVARRNAPALLCDLIPAARTADTLKDAGAHERLEHRLQMAWRQIMPRGQV